MNHSFVIRNLTTGWYYISLDKIYSERIVLATKFVTYESALATIRELPKGFYEIVKVYE